MEMILSESMSTSENRANEVGIVVFLWNDTFFWSYVMNLEGLLKGHRHIKET